MPSSRQRKSECRLRVIRERAIWAKCTGFGASVATIAALRHGAFDEIAGAQIAAQIVVHVKAMQRQRLLEVFFQIARGGFIQRGAFGDRFAS